MIRASETVEISCPQPPNERSLARCSERPRRVQGVSHDEIFVALGHIEKRCIQLRPRSITAIRPRQPLVRELGYPLYSLFLSSSHRASRGVSQLSLLSLASSSVCPHFFPSPLPHPVSQFFDSVIFIRGKKLFYNLTCPF